MEKSLASERSIMHEYQGEYGNKPRYRVNLIRQQCVCEINFLRITKLLPMLSEKDHHSLSISHGSHWGDMHFQVVERARYTTVINISMEAPWGQWLTLPQMQVRLYHDVRMAEVISAQKTRRLQPLYQYPNEKMLLPDEKEQLNRFLSEWLDFCLTGGHVQEKII